MTLRELKDKINSIDDKYDNNNVVIRNIPSWYHPDKFENLEVLYFEAWKDNKIFIDFL